MSSSPFDDCVELVPFNRSTPFDAVTLLLLLVAEWLLFVVELLLLLLLLLLAVDVQILLLLLLTDIGLATLSTISGGLPTLSCDGSTVLALLLIVCDGDGDEWWNV